MTRQTRGEYAGATPFVLADVELAEGPRVVTNVVRCEPDELSVGEAVRVVFHDTGEGPALPRFTPVCGPPPAPPAQDGS